VERIPNELSMYRVGIVPNVADTDGEFEFRVLLRDPKDQVETGHQVLRFRGMVEPDIHAAPRNFLFLQRRADDASEQIISLDSRSGRAFAVAEVKCDARVSC
jgi:hypothetical protein